MNQENVGHAPCHLSYGILRVSTHRHHNLIDSCLLPVIGGDGTILGLSATIFALSQMAMRVILNAPGAVFPARLQIFFGVTPGSFCEWSSSVV